MNGFLCDQSRNGTTFKEEEDKSWAIMDDGISSLLFTCMIMHLIR